MRIIFIFFLLISMNVQATKYYVANAGSDVANGLTTATAWQTLAKVNSSSFNPGDSILLNSGDTWNERLFFTSSGTQISPITISSYGTGSIPLITGFQSLSGFTNVGSIWTAIAVNSAANQNMLLINGVPYAYGRYPNTGYLTFTTSDTASITGTLPNSPSYVGKGQLVVRSAPWVLDRSIVTSQISGKLIVTSNFTYPPGYGANGYFFQNDSSFLDTNNEWAFKQTTKSVSIFSAISPANVQYSTIDTLVWVKGNWLTFNGIKFTGANQKIFQLDTARGITIQNCCLNYSGSFGILALKSNLLTINNDSIQNCYSGAIYGRQLDYYTTSVNQCDSATVTNSYIAKIGTLPGMGESGNARYNAIYIQGVNLGPKIIGNRIDSVGYIGIDFHGRKSLIKNNVISNACTIKSDGGGIYTVSNYTYLPLGISDSSLITSNIIYNVVGLLASQGLSISPHGGGIYLDNYTRLINVDSNTVYNCNGFGGVFFNQTSQIEASNNNLVNNYSGFSWASLSEGSANNMNIRKNLFYSNSAQNLIYSISQTSALYPFFGILDSNYYSNPTNELISFNTPSGIRSLSNWTAYSGLDIHSYPTPASIVPGQYLLLVNTANHDSAFTIPATYIDQKGNYYNGLTNNNTVTLHAYTSLTLLKTYTENYSGILKGVQNKIR